MTWQRKRLKTGQHGKRPQPSPEALQRKRDRADAKRMAGPCPPRPVEHKPGEERGAIEFRLDGRVLAIITLHQAPKQPRGRRTRVDTWEARAPWGDVIATGGWHAICRAAIAKVIPRQLSRDAIAGLGG